MNLNWIFFPDLICDPIRDPVRAPVHDPVRSGPILVLSTPLQNWIVINAQNTLDSNHSPIAVPIFLKPTPDSSVSADSSSAASTLCKWSKRYTTWETCTFYWCLQRWGFWKFWTYIFRVNEGQCSHKCFKNNLIMDRSISSDTFVSLVLIKSNVDKNIKYKNMSFGVTSNEVS